MNYNLAKEEATLTLAGFLAGPLSWLNWNLEMLVFGEGGKPENLEKNPESKVGINNTVQTQPTYDELELNPGHTAGRRALSALRHSYSPKLGI